MKLDFGIYLTLIAIAIILAILNRKNYPKFSTLVIWLLILTLSIEVSKFNFPEHKAVLNIIYYLGEILLLGSLYVIKIKNRKVKKTIQGLVYFLALSYVLINYLLSDSSFLIITAINHVFFLILGIIYVFETYLPPFEEGSLIRNPFFWINTANLFYFSGLFLQVGFDNYIKSFSIELSDQLHSINATINYIYYSLFSIGFICKKIFK